MVTAVHYYFNSYLYRDLTRKNTMNTLYGFIKFYKDYQFRSIPPNDLYSNFPFTLKHENFSLPELLECVTSDAFAVLIRERQTQ